MKIKIVEPGWAGYTGHFGLIEFIDGISADEVSRADAAQLAGLVAIETLEGVNPSSTQALVDAHFAAPISTAAQAAAIGAAAALAEPVVPAGPRIYTEAELGAIADEKGMAGIREIAVPLGLRDNKIAELIAKILAHQAAQKLAEPAPAPTAPAAE